MNALDVFPDIEELEPASQFLYACFKELPYSLDISPELCMTILSKHPSRYEELKVAHQARDIRAVEHLCGAPSVLCMPRITLTLRQQLTFSEMHGDSIHSLGQ